MIPAYRIWDLPLRLFHWLLLISLVSAYITGSLGGLWLTWHSQLGILIFALIVFRLIWGFYGSTYSRFSSFFPTPRRLKEHFASTSRKMGHTPLGAISIFTMLSLTLIQASFGLFALNDEIEFHGPLYPLISSSWSEQLTTWHTQLINVLLFFVVLHVIAIAYYTWIKHINLVTPMVTGKAHLPTTILPDPIKGGGKIALLLSIGLTALLTWFIANEELHRWLLN